METNDPSGRLTVEDLSDCRSESSHSETQLRAFQDYERIKELNLSVEKTKEDSPVEPKDFHLGLEAGKTSIRFDEFARDGTTRNLSMTINKGKDFGYITSNLNELNYSLERSNENDESVDTTSVCRTRNSGAKDLLFNLREPRQKNPHAALSSLDRYGKDMNLTVEKDIKDFGLLKNYSLDRMKEFNLSLDRMRDSHISNFALERLRGGAVLLENPSILEHNEFKNLQVQPRSQELEAIALERMRRSHLLGTDLSPQNLSTQLPHSHSITHMQHSQQQQQQQAKSFTIDAILGLRNNQREKRSQQQQYRKHQGPEGAPKNGSSSSCSGGGGKLKRVRTIFTAEQLERLEGEFARQQYMVGPERLYLAHALRLTEAQVKVWFQNRRIKWRKHHHEQQSQRVHEFQRSLSTSLEHEDSNEADKWCPTAEQVASYYSSTNSYKLHKNHACPSPTYSRYTSPQSIETTHQGPPTHLRPNKETRYSPNVAAIRKNCYEENAGNNDKRRYITEELGNFTEDNVEEDGGEEVEDDQEEAGEFLDKDYEEQEADDEIDEESDTYPQFHRLQPEMKKEGTFRCQQPWKSHEQQQESRRPRYHQYIPPPHENLPSGRYYHNTTEYDMPEHVLEEDYARNSTSLRSPSRRPPIDYHHWTQSRSSANRYDATPSQCQTTRRSRTKPEVNSPIDAEFGKAKRCSRCGSFENRNASSSGRNNCRFDDRLSFPTKGPIGDEAEVRQQSFCGQCNFRHNVGCDYSTSNAYPTKGRRSRDVKSPIYESAQQSHHVLEKVTKDCPRVSARYSKDLTNMLPEKSKRSVHTTHGTVRTSSQYAD